MNFDDELIDVLPFNLPPLSFFVCV